MNSQGKRVIYLNDFTAEFTQYVHLKAKNETQVIQETTCYESLTKKCICNKKSQIAKFLAWGSLFQVQVLHGTKASEWTLNVKHRKKPPAPLVVLYFGQDMSINSFLSLICLVTFLKCWQFCKINVLFSSWGRPGQGWPMRCKQWKQND